MKAEKREVQIAKRHADEPTVTITARTAITSIVTVTALMSTESDCRTVVSMIRTTHPETTVTGREVCTITAPGVTSTLYIRTHARTYVSETISIVWTYTSTTTPAASATACRREGGHFCDKLLSNFSRPGIAEVAG